MKIDIINMGGDKTGKKANLSDDIFAIEPNDHTIYLAVKQYMAHQRQGTHQTKERNAIKGSTKKIKKQKGTGTARFGDIKNPLFRGGGRVFGPRVRDYKVKLNMKVSRLAKKSALSHKAKDNNVIVVDSINIDEPKTKLLDNMLNSIGVSDERTLLVIPEKNENLYLSGRNIPCVHVTLANQLNIYDIMNAGKIVFAEDSIKILEDNLSESK